MPDGGHKSAGFDGSFAIDDEALANFGKESVKKGHDVAIEIIKKAYGRAPERSYFIGGSQGGHEALDAAARYSEDYDGVVAHYPAYNVTLLHLGSLNAGRAVYEGGGAAWLSPAKTKLITDAVYATRRPRWRQGRHHRFRQDVQRRVRREDSVADVRTEPMAATRVYRMHSLRQSRRSHRITSLASRLPAWIRSLGGRCSRGLVPRAIQLGPGAAAVESALRQGAPALYRGDQTAKFIISRNPKLDTMTFDPKQYQSRIATVASIMDVTDVSLEKFKARRQDHPAHGTADDFITPHNTELYYQRQVKQFGQAGVDSFIRFYMIPGFGHGFGPFNAKIDSLTALQAWVEQGQHRRPHGDRWEPQRESLASAVRVAEVAEVHGAPGSEGNAWVSRAWRRSPQSTRSRHTLVTYPSGSEPDASDTRRCRQRRCLSA